MGALLAAMQWGVAFRTVAVPIDPVRQLRGTTEAASGGHCLYQARQARTGYVERRFRARGPGPLVAAAALSEIRAVRVHVAWLSVLSIAVHGELGTPKIAGGTNLQTRERPVCRALPIDHHVSGAEFRLQLLTSGYRRESVERAERSAQTGQETRQCRKSMCTTVRVSIAR